MPVAIAMSNLEITAGVPSTARAILTPPCLAFVRNLCRAFEPTRQTLLARRLLRQKQFNAGVKPGFLKETETVRNGHWRIAPLPPALADRRVEITGPVERKTIINGLNSGAKVFMADFEDSLAPTWANLLEGQANLFDAVRHTISFVNPDGRNYRLNDATATLFVRPRGWHLHEKHVRLEGKPVSASLFDFGVYFFHNANELTTRGTAPYFYLPKMESHGEARLWNEVFSFSEDALRLPRGTVKATALIETLPAAFEMDEILYELREHSAGLNCGRWDYIFSCIKKFHNDPRFILADRARVTMTAPFMRAYSLLAIATCHLRGAHAMGGMAAQIPIKTDPVANEAALERVRADKEREATDGHDGTWVAHPALVPVAREIFDRIMPTPNQIEKEREPPKVSTDDLLNFAPAAPITEAGVKNNIEVAVHYLGAWLSGVGCVPIHHLMEDAATAEISRTQLWHGIRSPRGMLDDGRKVTLDMVRTFLPGALNAIRASVGEAAYVNGKFDLAARRFTELLTAERLPEFLTLHGYDDLN